MLDKLIQQAQSKGLISICPIQFKGRAAPVLSFINLMTTTYLYSPDKEQFMYLAQQSDRNGGATW